MSMVGSVSTPALAEFPGSAAGKARPQNMQNRDSAGTLRSQAGHFMVFSGEVVVVEGEKFNQLPANRRQGRGLS